MEIGERKKSPSLFWEKKILGGIFLLYSPEVLKILLSHSPRFWMLLCMRKTYILTWWKVQDRTFSHPQTSFSSATGPTWTRLACVKMRRLPRTVQRRSSPTYTNPELNASEGASTCLSPRGPSEKLVTCQMPRCDQVHCAESTQTGNVKKHLTCPWSFAPPRPQTNTCYENCLLQNKKRKEKQPSLESFSLCDMRAERRSTFHDANGNIFLTMSDLAFRRPRRRLSRK